VIRSEHLPPSLQMINKAQPVAARTMVETIENLEKELIIDALKKSGGRQRRAAFELGITERMLGYKIKRYGILPKFL
jgi:Nif-specific regulatory protein